MLQCGEIWPYPAPSYLLRELSIVSQATPERIVIATRESRLALWQAEYVKARLEEAHPGLLVTLVPMVSRYPRLKVVMEHITTAQAAEFVLAASDRVAATITPQHLLMNRNHLLVGGIRPHNYCLPVLKRESHREALVAAVTSGNPRFFLGTDSAPHALSAKENACGCAGCYTAHAGIELYAEVFDAAGALDKLEAFASLNGPAFYGLPPNPDTITLVREAWTVPVNYPYLGSDPLVPLRAGEQVGWKLVTEDA